MQSTTETIGADTGVTGWRKTWQRNWTPPAQPCGHWKLTVDTQTKALKTFGLDRQIDKCIEELGELATALVKYRHGEADAAAVIDELADVAVTTGTLWLLFDRKAVESRIAVKLTRLQKLVDQVVPVKPEKPKLRWEDEGNALALYLGYKQIGTVELLPVSGRWIGDPFGKTTATADKKEDVMRHVEKAHHLPEVPLWKP